MNQAKIFGAQNLNDWVPFRPAPLGACVLRKSKLLRSRVCAWVSEPTLLVRFPP